MTREQIEQAALKCAKDRWGDSESQHAMAKAQGTVYGFKQGAHWRINSVWHVTFEMPERNRDFLYESARGWFGINNIAKMAKEVHPEDWDRFVEGFDVIRWAYVDDLLPERKEDAE